MSSEGVTSEAKNCLASEEDSYSTVQEVQIILSYPR